MWPTDSEESRYPVGTFHWEDVGGAALRVERIEQIAELPTRLRAALADIVPAEWHARYREGGWTVRQLVHHVADSHVNAYVRFRLAITEETPTIRTYDEVHWAELPDVGIVPPEVSLSLLDSLHTRWAALLRALPDEAFSRQLDHPGIGLRITLDQLLGQYAWHGRHHTAHVAAARRHAARSAGGAFSGQVPPDPVGA